MTSILAQKPVLAQEEVLRGLQQYDRRAKVQISQMILYPYYFFEYTLRAKSLLKLNGKVACTIDALSGQGALADVQPEFSSSPAKEGGMLPVAVAKDEAKRLAENFIIHTLSQKTKFLTVPRLHLADSSLFYRPFWLAQYRRAAHGQQQLIVDAVSGSYHPL
ncbi:hypothetical protein [Pseudobacillus badius]|uniref:hypothetical protein n=1 Tax=Bacillus badius TaxID=1455 RepID=UPI0007B3C42B|nr:hypothetical protein [Bacillus badius]KZR57749.1 hypothetical protein A3781_02940 [Bacillus badius]